MQKIISGTIHFKLHCKVQYRITKTKSISNLSVIVIMEDGKVIERDKIVENNTGSFWELCSKSSAHDLCNEHNPSDYQNDREK